MFDLILDSFTVCSKEKGDVLTSSPTNISLQKPVGQVRQSKKLQQLTSEEESALPLPLIEASCINPIRTLKPAFEESNILKGRAHFVESRDH